jgi:hypothetical protein
MDEEPGQLYIHPALFGAARGRHWAAWPKEAKSRPMCISCAWGHGDSTPHMHHHRTIRLLLLPQPTTQFATSPSQRLGLVTCHMSHHVIADAAHTYLSLHALSTCRYAY